MSKGGKRSSKKSAASKRTAASKKMAQTSVRPQPSQGRANLELFGTSLAVLILALLLGGLVVSDPTRGTATHAWEHARTVLAGWHAPIPVSAQTWKAWMHTMHRFTSACFFLPGARDATVAGALWQSFSALWSYELDKYERSPYDVCFAVTWGLVLLVVRTVLMRVLLLPLAQVLVRRPNGAPRDVKSVERFRRKVHRFAEQGWILILYAMSLVLVVAVARRQPFWLWKPEQLWLQYPRTTMDALTKAVYLWEASNYIHQVFVINLEERRSDFWQMLTHHIVTLFLIGGSYMCCFHPVGIVVLLLMDPADVCLSTAKLLKYMGWQTLCDIMFGIFMIVWVITRHIAYLFVWWTCYKDAPALIRFSDRLDVVSGHALTPMSYIVFLVLLAILQAILLVWFGMIVNVAVRVLTQKGAIDSRSDDSDE
ncbi:sphingosine N-acyltransferase [Malassezia caprae]|uniref:Sphingosine N-acyltransferase n=1 Tax=Malassezia caprae TaxID=1381934 RepID=A0AAF0IV60_9BASI|nr:sphingosine N-acyltransferase [Malassezia caprae]